jgi:hydroxypyruvate isomerase
LNEAADVPGRKVMGTREMNYPMIAKALLEINYRGVNGLEALATGDSGVALARFKVSLTSI